MLQVLYIFLYISIYMILYKFLSLKWWVIVSEINLWMAFWSSRNLYLDIINSFFPLDLKQSLCSVPFPCVQFTGGVAEMNKFTVFLLSLSRVACIWKWNQFLCEISRVFKFDQLEQFCCYLGFARITMEILIHAVASWPLCGGCVSYAMTATVGVVVDILFRF